MKKLLLLLVILMFGCNGGTDNSIKTPNSKLLTESTITSIPLSGKLADRNAEISGLAWYNNLLVLLPQFPARFGNSKYGAIPVIREEAIYNYLYNNTADVVEHELYTLIAPGLEGYMDAASGFEACDFVNDNIYVTIEKADGNTTQSFIVKGIIDSSLKVITLNSNTLTKIDAPEHLYNFSCESLFQLNEKLYAIYEANGVNVNKSPLVYCFDPDLNKQDNLSFPNIEYRITDAVADRIGQSFWAINYNYPGDSDMLNPGNDNIAADYGIGFSHSETNIVERIIKFDLNDSAATFTNNNPVYIELDLNNGGKNWEGITLFRSSGFLLVTDKFPETIIAFVQYELN